WWQLDADSVAQRVTRDSTAELGGESGRASGPESALPAFENASPAPPAASYRLVSGSEPIAGTAEGEESTAPVAGAAEGDASPEPIAETADEVSSSETASNDGEATPVTGQSDMAAALEIELRFDQDSWAEIVTASGERLLYGTITAGREERIAADSDVSVRLGNADGVSIKVNGEPFAYPPGSRRGSLAVFTLSFPED